MNHQIKQNSIQCNERLINNFSFIELKKRCEEIASKKTMSSRVRVVTGYRLKKSPSIDDTLEYLSSSPLALKEIPSEQITEELIDLAIEIHGIQAVLSLRSCPEEYHFRVFEESPFSVTRIKNPSIEFLKVVIEKTENNEEMFFVNGWANRLYKEKQGSNAHEHKQL